MTRNKQFIAVVVLSVLVAIEAFFLTGTPAKLFAPEIGEPVYSDQYSAVFRRPARLVNAERTLRPEGQTEVAELLRWREFEEEVSEIPMELIQPVYTIDRAYISPTLGTAKLILKRAFRKLEDVYVPEAYDCDDNATELLMLLRKEALIEYREFPAALAVGFVGVRINAPIQEYPQISDDPEDYPMYHAMVVMRLKGNHWLLIEPLTYQVCELTGPIYEGVIAVQMLYF